MKSSLAVALVVLAATIESTAIVVALVGAVAGVAALGYAFYRTEHLRRSIEAQRRALERVKERVEALEPPRPTG